MQLSHSLLEVISKRYLIQEHPWVMVLFVELVFELSDASHGIVCISISGKHQEGGVGSAGRNGNGVDW